MKKTAFIGAGFKGLVVLFLAAAALVNVWSCKTKLESYASLSAETAYVGMQKCQTCHQDVYKDYIETGMGRSFYRPNNQSRIESEGAIVYDALSDFYYTAFWAKDSMFIKEYKLSPDKKDTLYARTERVDYIVGSGRQTRSYLMERNGYIYEAPITWYAEKKKWDMSPGYHDGNNTRFSREIGETCLNCHNGYARHVSGTVNRFEKIPLGIDCERCHGPGGAHVERMEAGDEIDVGKEIDYSIVNPQKLSIDLQTDVCQQCHLQGVLVTEKTGRFRPAEKLSDAFDLFVVRQAGDENQFSISSHAARLKRSRCFTETKGGISCTSCHNPHKPVAKTDPRVYQKNCLSCHEQKGCKAPMEVRKSKNDECFTCHLPQGGTSDIPHVRFTDHYIRVVKADEKGRGAENETTLVCGTRANPPQDAIGKAYLLYYEQSKNDRSYLALAEKNIADSSVAARAKLYYYMGNFPKALSYAKTALQKKSNDTWTLYIKGETLRGMKRFDEAAAVFEQTFTLNPSITEAAVRYALCIFDKADRGALPKARAILENALKQKPFDEGILTNLGFVALNEGKFSDANRYLLQALSLNPNHAPALENMAYYFIVIGNKAEAQKMIQKLQKQAPEYAGLPRLKSTLENS